MDNSSDITYHICLGLALKDYFVLLSLKLV